MRGGNGFDECTGKIVKAVIGSPVVRTEFVPSILWMENLLVQTHIQQCTWGMIMYHVIQSTDHYPEKTETPLNAGNLQSKKCNHLVAWVNLTIHTVFTATLVHVDKSGQMHVTVMAVLKSKKKYKN